MNSSGEFQVAPLPMVGQYNVQRFRQFSPEDSANWYVVDAPDTKKKFAMYPTFGRRHIHYLGYNRLIFAAEPRNVFRSVNYWYAVVGNAIYRVDKFYQQVNISGSNVLTSSGNIWFDFLVVSDVTFACFTDGKKIYVYDENNGIFYVVTDPLAPSDPTYIVAFGNRIAVSVNDSATFFLSAPNLGGIPFNPATCFNVNGKSVFAQEDGIVRQFGVLQNTLYIFTDFTTGVWSNTPSTFSGTGEYFPWKKNTTYEWNFGIADPLSLDIDFGYITFLAQNKSGLFQVMTSKGGEPQRISSKAIDTLFQRYANSKEGGSPFLSGGANGFMYQYENTIFYRLSAGKYNDFGILDLEDSANSIEYNFETQTWHRCIELNGERNRIQTQVFFNNQHLVTVNGEGTVYEMSGKFYDNEVRNPLVDDVQADNAYIRYPFRYERVSPIVSEEDYAEFETEYVEIDFVFGDSDIVYSTGPFQNAQFIIDEVPATDGNPQYLIAEGAGEPVFLITEQGNYPQINETTYNALFKPHIELYFSDDGGISFLPADVRQFSDMGVYKWKMRWYQLGCSRNRVYKLIAVSPVPIVVLGAVMNVRRVSGGAN